MFWHYVYFLVLFFLMSMFVSDIAFGKRKKLIRDDTATCDDILLQTLGMESSYFNKIRKTHSSVNNDSEVFCERFNRDKLPKFPSSTSPSGTGGGAAPISSPHNRNRNYSSSYRKNAKRKLNQILQLLSKEISSTQKSKAGFLPETAVRNIMRSLESQLPLKNGGVAADLSGGSGKGGVSATDFAGGETGSNSLYLISKVETSSKLNLDTLRQFGLVSQSICDGIGSRVVDIGSTGTIEPSAVMSNKVSAPHSLSLQKSPSHILSNFNFKTDSRIAGAFESATKLRENGKLDSSLGPLFLNGKHLNGSATNVDHALNGVDACQKSPESPRAEVIVSNCNFKCNNQVSTMTMNGCNENGKLYKIVSSLAAASPPTSKFCPKKKFITELTNGKSTFSFGVNSLDMLPSHVNSQTSLVGKNGVTLSSKNDIITWCEQQWWWTCLVSEYRNQTNFD